MRDSKKNLHIEQKNQQKEKNLIFFNDRNSSKYLLEYILIASWYY